MDARYIAAAVPFFFALIGVELLWNWRRGRDGDLRYNFHDSVTNLSCGIGQQVCEVLYGGAVLVLYIEVYEYFRQHFHLPTVSPRSVPAWIVLLFGVDLCYYAFHRASHRVNFLWAGHIVHHQSEEYNLSVALRQSWFLGLFSWVFYIPLAVAGFPPLMYLLMRTFNTLYQFWIHTRSVGRMGVLEWVLNTPSHHRVHHGIDPAYIDKNYAGIFIVWDRLFGTFTPETDEPVYGTVKPLSSFNPAWANIEHWAFMGRLMHAAPRLRDKLYVPFAPPEWRPKELGGNVVIPAVSRAAQRRYDVPGRRALDRYVAVHFVVLVLATTGFLLLSGASSTRMTQLYALGAAIVLSVLSFGGLLEGRRWALVLEPARLVFAAALCGWFTGSAALAGLCAVGMLGAALFTLRA